MDLLVAEIIAVMVANEREHLAGILVRVEHQAEHVPRIAVICLPERTTSSVFPDRLP